MTLREKVIVSAYTEILMCDFNEVQKYIEEKLGRPVLTHEFCSDLVQWQIKEAVKPDFMALCEEEQYAKWEMVTETKNNTVCGDGVKITYKRCSNCEQPMGLSGDRYCGNCGKEMVDDGQKNGS